MSVLGGGTIRRISRTHLRVLKSDLYRQMSYAGWFHFTPYDVADCLCALNGGGRPEGYGLARVLDQDGTPAVRTVPLLLALGYGTRRKACYEWLDRHWPDGKREHRREDETQAG